MNTTIKDVANKANVSGATVSRVLNGQTGYSEETKKRVLKAIVECEYSPNAIARGLASKITHTIGVLVPDISTMFVSKILNGLETVTGDREYSVIVSNTGIDGEKTFKSLNLMTEKRVDGLIFISEPIKDEYYKAIGNMKIPAVLVSTMSYKFQIPYVKVDDKQAAYSAVQYLIEKGHKRIAMISGNENDFTAGRTRVEGYLNALRDYDLKIDDSLIKYGDFSYKSGIRCMQELFEEGRNKFTAVFATSDDMAIGALMAAYNNNIRVPEELSVIGYDNTQVAERSIPPLTVVAQPFEEIGRKAAENIIIMIEEKRKVENIIIPHYIVERKSVKKML